MTMTLKEADEALTAACKARDAACAAMAAILDGGPGDAAAARELCLSTSDAEYEARRAYGAAWKAAGEPCPADVRAMIG